MGGLVEEIKNKAKLILLELGFGWAELGNKV